MLKKRIMVSVITTTLAVGLFVPMNKSISASTTKPTCSTAEECDALINDTKEQISDIKDKQNETQSELNKVENSIGATLDKISSTENSISSFQNQITAKEAEIVSSEEEIQRLEGEISRLKEIVGQRMRISQRFSKTNMFLEVLSESSSIIDLVRRLQVVNHFAESDAEAMDELKELVTTQQTLLNNLKVQKDELAAAKKNLEAEKANLVAYNAQLKTQKDELAKQIQQLESERLSAAEILKIAEDQKKVIVSQTTGGFGLPLVSGYVSCEYMCYTNHTGIDLGNYGDTSTSVVASAAGTVVRSGWHKAYGWHVMITHNMDGQTMTTVYAHMHSKPLVSVGDQISKGAKLGTMGNTGNSFGAHLHFEMYKGYYNYPYAVNPRNYISFPSKW